MGSIYTLTLRQLLGARRLLTLVVLAALPVILTLAMLASGDSPSVAGFERIVVNGLLIGAITPLVVLAIATAGFGNELEDRTLANLTLSPLPRWKIALPKLLAAFTVAAPFVVASGIVIAQIAFLGDLRATAAMAITLLVEVALYSAAFTWLGLASSQAMGAGLLYVVLWEGFFASFVFGVRVFSIRYQSVGLMHALDGRRFEVLDHLPTTAAVLLPAVVLVGFVLLTVRRLRRMDVP